MAGGFIDTSGSKGKRYAGKTTAYVFFACLMAACGGLMFGYDIGISGGVISMEDFLQKFFPDVYKAKRTSKNNYCLYNNQSLQAFTSSLYLAGMVASFCASTSTRRWGRTRSIMIGGSIFLLGAVMNLAAQNLPMIIVGRLLLGTGIGFVCQAVPLYLSEIAPAHLRGALNIMFQLIITISILCANLVNFGMEKVTPWGWRISLGIAAVPGAIVTVGSFFLPETPNSLLERGKKEEARRVLEKIRGTLQIDEELEDLIKTTQASQSIEHPYRNLLKVKYIPQLTVGVFIEFFSQMSGINAVMFYAPVLFKTIGFGNDAALYSAVIVGAVNVLSTLVAVALVDKWGRKPLFYQSGVQMFVSLMGVGIILQYNLGLHGQLSKALGAVVVVLICLFVSAFAWSWGPLSWLIPSEIFPMEVRTSGFSICVGMNLFWRFAIGQSLLTLLCVMRFGIFFFFGAWVALMTLFAFLLYPETKNVPIEQVVLLFKNHWFWKRIVPVEEHPRMVHTGVHSGSSVSRVDSLERSSEAEEEQPRMVHTGFHSGSRVSRVDSLERSSEAEFAAVDIQD